MKKKKLYFRVGALMLACERAKETQTSSAAKITHFFLISYTLFRERGEFTHKLKVCLIIAMFRNRRSNALVVWGFGGTLLQGSPPEVKATFQKCAIKSYEGDPGDGVSVAGRRSAARVEAPEASPSQRKPEQGQYPAGIHHTGICQTKTSFWKFGEQFGVTAFPAPHYGTFRRTKGEEPHAGCFSPLIFVVNAKAKGNNYNLEAEAEGSAIRWRSARLGIRSKIQ